MDPKTLGSYGAPKLDALPVSNPETQVAASEMNRYMEDLAQTTNTVARAIVRFTTTGLVGPIPAASVFHRSLWGSGDAQKPTVIRTAVGLYSVTYDATFTDPLGYVETVAFFDGHCSARSIDSLDNIDARTLSVVSNIVQVAAYDTTAAPALADIGNNSGNPFDVTLWLV